MSEKTEGRKGEWRERKKGGRRKRKTSWWILLARIGLSFGIPWESGVWDPIVPNLNLFPCQHYLCIVKLFLDHNQHVGILAPDLYLDAHFKKHSRLGKSDLAPLEAIQMGTVWWAVPPPLAFSPDWGQVQFWYLCGLPLLSLCLKKHDR